MKTLPLLFCSAAILLSLPTAWAVELLMGGGIVAGILASFAGGRR